LLGHHTGPFEDIDEKGIDTKKEEQSAAFRLLKLGPQSVCALNNLIQVVER
jgi:hypothetical protein